MVKEQDNSDHSFLRYFIEEEIYVIPEDSPTLHSPDPSAMEETPSEEKEVEQKKEEAPNFSKLNYKGGHLKKITILVDEGQYEFLGPKEEDFLMKVLSAVKLGLDDIALVNVQGFDRKHAEAQLSTLETGKLLAFGCLPPWELDSEKKYSLQKHGSTHLLLADGLKDIASDKLKKIMLWDKLQKLFP